uniref:Apyrase n=1 Tax=Mesocestoides corti TaxID=53468 RepID=A0A5K3FVH4_MESCO
MALPFNELYAFACGFLSALILFFFSAPFISYPRPSLIVISLLVIYLSVSLDWLLSLNGENVVSYVVIFDAGSTGSRARVYTLRSNASEKCLYELVNEKAFSVEPGLSEFVSLPNESAEYLQPLLDRVKKCIPPKKWAETPIILRATAGLRLLPNETASAILESVAGVFNKSGFRLPVQGAVSILDGTDEGFFAWLSLQFLRGGSCLGKDLSTAPKTTSQAIFDLGGASFQLAFLTTSVESNEGVHSLPSAYEGTQFAPLGGKFFAHSYLGLGLMTAMHSMLLRSSNLSAAESTRHLQSPCFPANTTGTWSHGREKWTVSFGPQGPQSLPDRAFNECFKAAVEVIADHGLPDSHARQLEDLKVLEIQAMSYMCTKTEEAERLSNRPPDGRIPVQWYFDAAKKFCSSPQPQQPFMCMELTYVAALLTHGLGLPMDKQLNLNRTIDSVEVGWPVGFLVDMLHRGL